MKTKNNFTGFIWIFLYITLIFTPMVVLLLGPKPGGRPALLDISVSLGFIGLAIMALQFVNSARLKFLNKPFGTDIIYHFHRQIGIAAFFIVFAHPILLFILDTRYLNLLNLVTAPWRARFAVTSTVLLLLVVWMAEYRQKLKIPYTFWKIWHGIFATLMVAAALVHIFLAGSYTDLPWKRVTWIAYSIMFVLMMLYTRVIYPLKLMRRPYTVIKVKEEHGDVWSIGLKPEKGKRMHFSAGQFAWMTAWKTPFSDTEHPFSFASSSEQEDFLEFSIKNLGAFTARIKNMKPGDKVYLDGPYGAFNLDNYSTAKNLVLIPGGIGITPIMSMLRTLADRGDKRPIKLFYCNLTWDTVAFREEIAELEKKLDLQVIYTIEKPPVKWKGESGFLNASILEKYIPQDWFANDSQVFLCGPIPMMNAVEKALQQVGFEENRVHSERYSFA